MVVLACEVHSGKGRFLNSFKTTGLKYVVDLGKEAFHGLWMGCDETGLTLALWEVGVI